MEQKTHQDFKILEILCGYENDIDPCQYHFDSNVNRAKSIHGRAPRQVVAKHVNSFKGFAIDLGFVEMESRFLGDLVVPLLV